MLQYKKMWIVSSKKVKKQRKARENPKKPYFYLPPDLLRMKVDQKKRESQRTLPKSDYNHSLTKSFEAVQKKTRAGKGVAQLGQQSQQSVPPLIIHNEYGSNLDVRGYRFGPCPNARWRTICSESGSLEEIWTWKESIQPWGLRWTRYVNILAK